MPVEGPKTLRCAIYTRKSTEHGLDQEFNSLDAQREACEAYIKSQASLGWKVLSQQYNDPAYSGGNLDRPALKRLLADIEANRVDVVVVYKIDRLTRSLGDFAKLVEAFDARSISFVAVTQQFNTTTSMGRLTLNILLSFAQFERELASERVKDKIAASRKKGKWTGGTVPLGYDARNRKLIPNKTEAETVRTIFRLYLQEKSFGKLVTELDRRGIVTKRRETRAPKYNGGIRFTYGPVAHFLKNRIYIGEIHYDGKWFKGEHEAIVNRATFNKVQELLRINSARRGTKYSSGNAPLTGKLYDDKGNRMGPSFSSKNGVRYRFYISRALRGRHHECGSVKRISAPEIEALVANSLESALQTSKENALQAIERIVLSHGRIVVELGDSHRHSGPIEIAWTPNVGSAVHLGAALTSSKTDEKLLKSIGRAHVWLNALTTGEHSSLDELSAAADLHPKVVRQGLQLAFLAPSLIQSALENDLTLRLKQIPKPLPLSWRKQLQFLDF